MAARKRYEAANEPHFFKVEESHLLLETNSHFSHEIGVNQIPHKGGATG